MYSPGSPVTLQFTPRATYGKVQQLLMHFSKLCSYITVARCLSVFQGNKLLYQNKHYCASSLTYAALRYMIHVQSSIMHIFKFSELQLAKYRNITVEENLDKSA